MRDDRRQVLKDARFSFCDAYTVYEAESHVTWTMTLADEMLCSAALHGLQTADMMARKAYAQFVTLISKFDCDDGDWSVSTCDSCLVSSHIFYTSY
jgi:hypothetical protein